MTRTNTLSLAALAAVVVLLIVAPLGLDPFGYTLRILCLMLLFCAMGQAWNIVGGLANQISLVTRPTLVSARTARRSSSAPSAFPRSSARSWGWRLRRCSPLSCHCPPCD